MHKLHGTYRDDRHKGRGDDDDTFTGLPKKPASLDVDEAKVWNRITGILPNRVLAQADEMELEAACRWYVKHQVLLSQSWEYAHDPDLSEKFERRAIKAWGIVDRILSRFGMTPADRVKLRIPKDESGANPLAEFGVVG